MTYNEALDRINGRLIFGSRPGLLRIEAALKALGNPQDRLKFVHVGGTNGKGTTCTYISTVLTKAGYKTGLFTSPYVVDFRERFRFNGEMISESELISQVEVIEALPKELTKELTEFEYITVLTMNWFLSKNCDIVVLEVGLGGRLDCTNVIKSPLAAVITSISLDHTAILGDTAQKIALEKAGIIKSGTTCVLYPEQLKGVKEIFEETCVKHSAKLIVADGKFKVFSESLKGTKGEWKGLKITVPFSGEHQVLNAVTALTTLDVLREKGFKIDDSAVQAGFEQSRIAARMELLSENPLVVLDGGHNPGCATALKKMLDKHVRGKTICAVMGMMKDKDSRSYLEQVAPLFKKIITVTVNNPRSLTAGELCNAAKEFCESCGAAETMEQAVEISLTSGCDAVIICGSLYLAGEIRGAFINALKK